MGDGCVVGGQAGRHQGLAVQAAAESEPRGGVNEDEERQRMTSDGVGRERQRQRGMVMSGANDGRLRRVLGGGRAPGSASRPHFTQLFPFFSPPL